jgi:hypothetical protein
MVALQIDNVHDFSCGAKAKQLKTKLSDRQKVVEFS